MPPKPDPVGASFPGGAGSLAIRKTTASGHGPLPSETASGSHHDRFLLPTLEESTLTKATNRTIPPRTAAAFVGMDLAKNSVPVHGVDDAGRPGVDRQRKPAKRKAFRSHRAPCVVGMEACGRAQPWGREVLAMGPEAQLMAPQFGKPYVQSNQNDRADATAICAALQRPNRRFVGIQSADRPAQQASHRIRSRAVGNRTAPVNPVRGRLAEFGIESPQGRGQVRPAGAAMLGNGGAGEGDLRPRFLEVLADLDDERVHLDERVDRYERMIEEMAGADEPAPLRKTLPGVGPMTATALLATMGDPGLFRNGRECAAGLGWVPKPYSTGGKERLLGISKRGDRYRRGLRIHGARARVTQLSRKEKRDRRSQWLQGLLERRHQNVATVALANRMARTAGAVLTSRKPYEENHGLA